MLPVVGENLAQSRAETASLLMASLIIDNAEPFAALLGTIAFTTFVLRARNVPVFCTRELFLLNRYSLHLRAASRRLDGTQVVRRASFPAMPDQSLKRSRVEH
jgi:hypothetical protein